MFLPIYNFSIGQLLKGSESEDVLNFKVSSPSSIVSKVILVQPEKALLPTDVTLLGIVTEVKPVQPWKAEAPIDVTLLGMVIEVKLQPEKASSPIEVTLLGMVIEVKLQP